MRMISTSVVRRGLAAIASGAILLSCKESVGPEPVASDWPWITTVASPGVAVTGASEPLPTVAGALRVSARFINPAADSIEVSHGSCAFGLRLREVNGRALMPVVWENRPQACTLELRWFVVPPADMRDVQVGTVKPLDFRGVIPPGDYWVNVIWRRYPSADLLEVNAGTIVVP